MKIMIMTDMEGVAGILNFQAFCKPNGIYYTKGCRLLTREVNAAVDGLFEGGTTEILVVDGHAGSNPGNIDPELLDERVSLLRGYPRRPQWGLDETFDGLVFVGQHAKAGTDYSHITHTMGWHVIDVSINGVSVGEYGQIALCAMELGVPTILACGEEALAKEAEALTPGAITAAGKRGLFTDGLEDLTAEQYRSAKLSAIHLSPARARAQIRQAALQAARKLQAEPSSFSYPNLQPPYTMLTRIRRTEDQPAREEGKEHPASIIELLSH